MGLLAALALNTLAIAMIVFPHFHAQWISLRFRQLSECATGRAQRDCMHY